MSDIEKLLGNTGDISTIVLKMPAVSDNFKGIFNRERLKNSDSRKEILDATNPGENSTYREKFAGKSYLKPENWASDSGLGGCFTFRDTEITDFLEKLFKEVAKEMAEKGDTKTILARSNLFHGHVRYSEELDDVLIVFHAFEYPKDTQELKYEQAKGLEDDVPHFLSTSSQYGWRNAVYSLNKNSLYIINADDSRYKKLLVNGSREIAAAKTLNEALFGDKVCDVNYFPKEGLSPFIC